MQPQFPILMQRSLYDQLYPDSPITSHLVLAESLPKIEGRIEVFNSAIATFRAPSDRLATVRFGTFGTMFEVRFSQTLEPEPE